MIRRLAYVSRPRPGLSLVEIPRIVASGRARNRMDSITGLLLFTGHDFVQLVEGSPTSVASLWARICADDRHGDIVSLFDERGSSRWFSDWRVGFPSDASTINLIATWRERAPSAWDDAKRAEMRMLLAAVDAI